MSLPQPLGGPAPEEVFLSRMPLVRVVAQLRFSTVLKIDSKDAIVPFQEEIRFDYPLLEQRSIQQLQVDFASGTPGIKPVASNLWQFSSADRSWALSLTSDAVTLETRQYVGRSDFLRRLRDALANVERIFNPALGLRIGVRYVNRISGESLTGLTEWVKPNLLGVAQPELRDHVTQAISEAIMTVEEGSSLLRWGVMPPGVTIDPGLLDPVPTPSWILDIDVWSEKQRPFTKDDLELAFRALAERAYCIFRYAVTNDGLTHFGAAS